MATGGQSVIVEELSGLVVQ